MNNQAFTHYPLTGIILAGGKSSRFQECARPWKDKALFEIAPDTSLLVHAIKTLAPFCKEIIIVVNNQERIKTYEHHLATYKSINPPMISFVSDDQQMVCSGPIRALLSTFPRVKTSYAVVLPVDMPRLSQSLMQSIIKVGMNCSLLYPFWPSTGKIEPLTFVARVAELLPYVECLRYFESSRADDIIRLAPNVSFLPIKKEQETFAKTIFQSINKRSDIALLFHTSSSDSVSNNAIFTIDEILTYQTKINQSLFAEFLTVIKDHLYFQHNPQNYSQVLQLARSLQKERLFFYAASLLAFILSSSPLDTPLQSSRRALTSECFTAFFSEAQLWEERKILFVAYHALLDAYKYLPSEKLTNEQLNKKISAFKERMDLKEKNHQEKTFSALLESRVSSNLLEKVKSVIQNAEAQFNAEAPPFESNFLWDHSLRVSKIAFKIAMREGVDPLIPVIAALLHDAGKFVLGQYHQGDLPEEEHSVTIAKTILSSEGFSKEQLSEVAQAINALYNEQQSCNRYCQIVHDADRLEKLGYLGVANFFTKMSLRGVNLTQGLLKHLSRELTYAHTAPKTMLTGTGKQLAEQLGKKTRNFFIDLLTELTEWGIGYFFIQEVLPPKGNLPVVLICPQSCLKCTCGKYTVSLSTESGIKCEKLVVNYRCNRCADSFSIHFCLPLIVTS